MSAGACQWLVWDAASEIVGVVEGPMVKADAMLLARRRYGRMVERVQSVVDAEIAATERAAARKRRLC